MKYFILAHGKRSTSEGLLFCVPWVLLVSAAPITLVYLVWAKACTCLSASTVNKAKWTQPNIGGRLNFPSRAVLLMRSVPFHGRSLSQFKLLHSLLVVLICRILSYRIQTTGYKCIDWNMEMEEFWISTTSSVMWQMTKTEWVQVQGSGSSAFCEDWGGCGWRGALCFLFQTHVL